MADLMDFFNICIMGSVQILMGFRFLVKLLHKRVRFYFYLLFAVCGSALICFVPEGRIAEFGVYVLLLTASGILMCRGDWKSVILYAALAVEVMQLCYGIMNSLLSVLYPLTSSYDRRVVGIVFMLAGNMALLPAWFCYYMIYRYFSYHETVKKQYVTMALIPLLLIFLMGEYINSIIYGTNITDGSGITVYTNHYQMLAIQLLGMASLFCILFAYKKLLQNIRLNTELSLLEQEEHSLSQYVEEAKTRYEKTRSFRHDIKNHITVLQKLLQSGKTEQALDYIGDLEQMAEELSFPCSTNNPVVDILVGNKLGIAKSMGIDVGCSLVLPYPCGLRDIDVCIILSNALDNAIWACKNMDGSKEKYIRVRGRIQGDFLFMELENSFQGNGSLRKGTGLSNIKAVAEKYHGAMSIKTQGGVFLLNVLLIIPQQSGSISRQMDLSDVSGSRKK